MALVDVQTHKQLAQTVPSEVGIFNGNERNSIRFDTSCIIAGSEMAVSGQVLRTLECSAV